jgi:hypothetical protein
MERKTRVLATATTVPNVNRGACLSVHEIDSSLMERSSEMKYIVTIVKFICSIFYYYVNIFHILLRFRALLSLHYTTKMNLET